MTVGDQVVVVPEFVHDAKPYSPGYGRTYYINDKFWPFQDLRWPRSEVPEEPFTQQRP